MNEHPKLELFAAQLNLLHMSLYADTMLGMVQLGAEVMAATGGYYQPSECATVEQPAKVEELNTHLTEVNEETALNGSKGAALIFVHAGLDSCLQKLLELSAKLDVRCWKTLIPDKKVSLSDVAARGVDALVEEQIASYLHALRRHSMLRKCKKLLVILKPSSGTDGEFTFDADRLERIELIRNDCAHGRVGVADFDDFDSDLHYLRDVGGWFIRQVANHYNIEFGKHGHE